MINIHILGAGGAVPTPTHCPAAYWMVIDGQPILVDPGPGALVRLVKSGQAPHGADDIDLVIFTHLHPDHSADLIALLFASHSVICTNTKPLRLFGPVGLKSLLSKLKDIYGAWLDPRSRVLEVTEWSDDQVLNLPNSGTVTPFRVNHPQDRLSKYALGYQFTDAAGNLVVFSGDTGPCEALNKAARGADLLIVECSTPDELATSGHMHPSAVGALCADSQPRQVVLTHQYPAAASTDLVAEVGKYYDGPVNQACDGSAYVIGGND